MLFPFTSILLVLISSVQIHSLSFPFSFSHFSKRATRATLHKTESIAIREVGKAIVISHFPTKYRIHNITLNTNAETTDYLTSYSSLDVPSSHVKDIKKYEDHLFLEIMIHFGGLAAEYVYSNDDEYVISQNLGKSLFYMAFEILYKNKDSLRILTRLLIEENMLHGEVIDFYVNVNDHYTDEKTNEHVLLR
jgi:hypothetical protein